MKLNGLFFLIIFLFTAATDISAQLGIVERNAKVKPKLIVLGTYHMGTPGNNVVNGKVDDISTPERQTQLVELIDKLKSIEPTKIVVECDLEKDQMMQDAFNEYLSGKYQLSKNETNQIGFRLAKALGRKKVYCVDWSDFWNDPSINYLKYAEKDPELNTFLKK